MTSPSPRAPGRLALALLASTLVLAARPLVARADGGDVRTLDFAASAPATYDHRRGGGAFDDGTIGPDQDVVESLEGGDFGCGDLVSYLTLVEIAATPTDPVQSLELVWRLSASTTGQPGAGHVAIERVLVDYGPVDGGDGPGSVDSGFADDGGSRAALRSARFVYDSDGSPAPGPFTEGASLEATAVIDDLEAGESVVVRLDARIGCGPGARPTGNLQGSLASAAIVEPSADAVAAGAQTINFKRIGALDGIGEAVPVLETTLAASGSGCPGVDVGVAAVGDAVTRCHALTNYGTEPMRDVDVVDDGGTIGDASDDASPSLFFLADLDADGAADDLASGETAVGWSTSAAAATTLYRGAARGADPTGEVLAEDSATLTVLAAVPRVTVDALPDTTSAGEEVTYAITVHNPGAEPLDELDLTFLLPGLEGAADPATRFVHVTTEAGPFGAPSTGAPARTRPFAGENREELRWDARPSLGPAETATVTLTARVGADVPGRSAAYRSHLRLGFSAGGTSHETWSAQVAPVWVTEAPASGASSGEDGGLESNDRLAASLARRAVGRRFGAPSDTDAVAASVAALGDAARILDGLLPPTPSWAAAVDVTPYDLLAYTNAEHVRAVDYLGAEPTRRASVLLVQTRGEAYEHNKGLCDRAHGRALAGLGTVSIGGVPAIRAVTVDERDRTRDAAVLFRIALSEGRARVSAAWLPEGHPDVGADETLVEAQIWSAQPGDAIALAEALVARLRERASVASEAAALPSAVVTRASLLGPELALTVRRRSTPGSGRYRVAAHVRRESGEVEHVALGELSLPHGDATLRFDVGRATSVTVELEEDGRGVIDRVWATDGAYTVVDDSLWGGASWVRAFSDTGCPAAPSPGAGDVALAGCASVEAEVDEMVAIVRHLAGAAAPLPLERGGGLRFTARVPADSRVCVEGVTLDGSPTTACAPLAASESPRDYAIPFAALEGPAAPATATLIMLTTGHDGEVRMTLSDLRIGRSVTTSVGTRPSDAGPRCAAGPGDADTRVAWVLLAAGLLAAARRRPRSA